jgi:peptidoglycan/LPS O-acetylase OafA/YrhL
MRAWLLDPAARLDTVAREGRALNNFDILRLLAAAGVLFSHSFVLTGNVEPLPPGLQLSSSAIGVMMFFAISGFLIARSWAYDPHPLSFAAKRGLRLVPALAVSLVATALILGPLVTTLPVRAYFSDPATKAYILDNLMLQTNYGLPGVFDSNVYPNAVNGSLWTLPLEVKAYTLAAILGLFGLFGRARVAMGLVAATVTLMMVPEIRDALPLGNRLTAMLVDVQARAAEIALAAAGAYNVWLRPFAAFLIGAALFALARWIPIRWGIAAVVVAIWAGATALGGWGSVIAATCAIPYLVLVLAYRTRHLVGLPARVGDYSYGLYIYAFPVQQALVHFLALGSGWVLFALATPATLALAVVSWHYVEAPALALKERLATPLAKPVHPLPREAA